ncbi:hypothetical protein ABT354_32880 [Streptomyces sp. NPDC000594]|uniref:hypothetical protein n=1 Tax=Streptomyces sp. NPDC000594 TaxID=3154261 RepID=UPI00331D4BE5
MLSGSDGFKQVLVAAGGPVRVLLGALDDAAVGEVGRRGGAADDAEGREAGERLEVRRRSA